MIEYLPLAISSLTAAKNIAASLLEIRDIDKITSATIDLKGHIVQTYDYIISEKERVSSLQSKIDELEMECSRLKDWTAEKEQWSLREVGQGNFAYVRNNFTGKLQETQKLCAGCYEKTIKSTLQERKIQVGRRMSLICPNQCPEMIFDCYRDEY
ncbi:MAG: hypothetical protein WA610_13650 [Thermodesulfovibrionales bacterium]